jgi:VWFA-related protein
LALRKLSIAFTAIWLVTLASSSPINAQNNDNLTVEIASIDNSAFPALSAVVNVLDAKGRPVPALDAAAFSATLDGKSATINNVQTVVDSQASLSVVLAVDASGSMAGQPLAASQAAAAEFVNGLSPQDSVAVLAFNDAVTVPEEATSDKAMAIDVLQRLTAAGNTALFEATSRAVVKAAESPSSRRVIILLSDGVDYGGKSTVSRDDSIAQARFAGIPIYTIALGADVDKAYLSDLAQATGARFLETPSPEGLSQLYADIAALLRGQYIVSMQSLDVDPAAVHSLELSVNAGGTTATASKAIGATGAVPTTEVTLQGLGDGQKLKSTATIVAGLSNGGVPSEVRFLVDGQTVATITSPPYQTTLDPAVISNGNHTLRIEVKNASGATATNEVRFAVGPTGAASSIKSMLLFGGLLALVIVLIGFYFLRLRRPHVRRDAVEVRLRPWFNSASLAGGISLISDEAPLSPECDVEEGPAGKLIMVGGPNAGQEFAVCTQPISIGSAPWCDIIIADGSVASEEARAWVHQDKLVFHRLMRLSLFANDQDAGGWYILEDGDEICVGNIHLRFSPTVRISKEEGILNKVVNEAVQRLATHQSGSTGPHGFASRLWPTEDPETTPEIDSKQEPEAAGASSAEDPSEPEDLATPAVWLVEEQRAESDEYPRDDLHEPPPTKPPMEQPSDQEAESPPPSLWPVDDLPTDASMDEEEADPPAAASWF